MRAPGISNMFAHVLAVFTLRSVVAGIVEDDGVLSPHMLDDDAQTQETRGNGFERIGIEGHGGMFSVFSWTEEELRQVSEWHATAQYQSVIVLLKEKLSSSDVHPIARQMVETFISRHRPPASVQNLLGGEDRKRIRLYHRRGDVGRILQVVGTRLAQLSPEARDEVVRYLTFPTRQ